MNNLFRSEQHVLDIAYIKGPGPPLSKGGGALIKEGPPRETYRRWPWDRSGDNQGGRGMAGSLGGPGLVESLGGPGELPALLAKIEKIEGI